MDKWFSLFEASVWPIFITIILVWLRKPLITIITALAKRVEAGAEITISSLKIGVVPGGLTTGDPLPKRLDELVEEAEAGIKDQDFLTIDSTPLLKKEGKKWVVPYKRFETVSSLLNDIWFTIGQYGGNLSFGSAWILRDTKTGNLFTDKKVGIRWAQNRHETADRRPLADVGIKPGSTIEVISPSTTQGRPASCSLDEA